MKRRLFGMAALAAVMGLSVATAAERPLTASIPFEFRVGSATLPAGDYTITRDLVNSRVMFFDEDGKFKAVVLANSCQRGMGAEQKGELVFNRYGNRYFLSKIWAPANSIGRQVPQSPAEKEMAKLVSEPLAMVRVDLR